MKDNKKDSKKKLPDEAVILGKKAIEAEKKSFGKDSSGTAAKDKEKKMLNSGAMKGNTNSLFTKMWIVCPAPPLTAAFFLQCLIGGI